MTVCDCCFQGYRSGNKIVTLIPTHFRKERGNGLGTLRKGVYGRVGRVAESIFNCDFPSRSAARLFPTTLIAVFLRGMASTPRWLACVDLR